MNFPCLPGDVGVTADLFPSQLRAHHVALCVLQCDNVTAEGMEAARQSSKPPTGRSDGYGSLDGRMGLVTHDLEVLEAVIEQARRLALDGESRQRQGLAPELLLHLLEVIHI